MKRTWFLLLAGLFASSIWASMPYYALELRGGSRVYSTEAPLRKGRVVLFHRYPDRVYVSLAADEVVTVVPVEAPQPQEKLTPGETVFIGTPLAGPNYQAPPSAAPPALAGPSGYGYGYGYGYTGYWWGGGGYLPPPGPPVPPSLVPSHIGPNGFPILAAPGSPGSVPPPIGSNGFPILAPQPPAASPRRP